MSKIKTKAAGLFAALALAGGAAVATAPPASAGWEVAVGISYNVVGPGCVEQEVRVANLAVKTQYVNISTIGNGRGYRGPYSVPAWGRKIERIICDPDRHLFIDTVVYHKGSNVASKMFDRRV